MTCQPRVGVGERVWASSPLGLLQQNTSDEGFTSRHPSSQFWGLEG